MENSAVPESYIGKISTDGHGDVVWVLNEAYDERNAELSPNGRWMAYQSDQSGRWEIEVRPFPDFASNSFQVSNNGGESPLWSRDGRELFYLGADPSPRLMAVTVQAADSAFSFTGRREVMRWPYFGVTDSPGGRPYDISADGQRFLALSEERAGQPAAEVVVVENWTEELKRLVPTK